jgi:hypothetical protein
MITDATGNNTYFGPAFSGKLDFPAKHPRMREVWTRPSRPSAGSTIITSTHFPEEYWGDYLNPNVIGFPGHLPGEVDRATAPDSPVSRQPDVVQSKDPNFRPIDTATGPDGALYVDRLAQPADRPSPEPPPRFQPRPCARPHLPHHLRGPSRSSWQPVIDGAPIPDLLELLKRKERPDPQPGEDRARQT